MKKTKKLSLKKEKISSLTNSDMKSIQGGVQQIDNDLAGSAGSSNHDFTCCWCTGGGQPATQSCGSGCFPNTDTQLTVQCGVTG
ncbi:hypothetical protein DRF59_07390 [Chryseobacterium flavum]|uniref:Uncharacterized protein n=1 Tax=Chryseobacterium flavum TaxID=415851 RepID=A0A3D9CNU4_9FLAO|nr:class I lanthipeptide [Chryseobacterium flavum]REC67456.1 hypothetical protein DRF59_07390 [Chryseobacterium flavum]